MAGLILLRRALRDNPDAYNKAVNACYLVLGEACRGDQGTARTYLELATRLDPACPVLTRIIAKLAGLGRDPSSHLNDQGTFTP